MVPFELCLESVFFGILIAATTYSLIDALLKIIVAAFKSFFRWYKSFKSEK